MAKIHGQATIRVNGRVFESEDDAALEVGGSQNNGRMIGQKFYHNESTTPSMVTCKVPVTADVSLKELQELKDAEVTFESDVGTIWIIKDAVQTNKLSLAGGADGGTVELQLTGGPAEEMR